MKQKFIILFYFTVIEFKNIHTIDKFLKLANKSCNFVHKAIKLSLYSVTFFIEMFKFSSYFTYNRKKR